MTDELALEMAARTGYNLVRTLVLGTRNVRLPEWQYSEKWRRQSARDLTQAIADGKYTDNKSIEARLFQWGVLQCLEAQS